MYNPLDWFFLLLLFERLMVDKCKMITSWWVFGIPESKVYTIDILKIIQWVTQKKHIIDLMFNVL